MEITKYRNQVRIVMFAVFNEVRYMNGYSDSGSQSLLKASTIENLDKYKERAAGSSNIACKPEHLIIKTDKLVFLPVSMLC